MVLRSDVLIGRRYLAIRGAKQKAKIRSGQEKILPERIWCSDATFSYEANRRPKWLLRPPEVEV